LSGPARILDCACGIGTQSLGLAKLGFQVTGCDLSPRSIERAQREALKRKLEIQFAVANMLDLSSLPENQFDAVLCIDNALPHLESEQQLAVAAGQIRSRLRAGGFLIASIRDYDRLMEERPVVQGPWFYTDGGKRRIVVQIWDWIDRQRYRFHIYISQELSKGWQTLHTSGSYRAVRRKDLTAVLTQAGFQRIIWLEPGQSGFYQPIVVAQAN
jgi:glycine/sarcosine N-methyltransferase